jgi:hypothetical protein
MKKRREDVERSEETAGRRRYIKGGKSYKDFIKISGQIG